jgi:CRISPR-associated protein Cas4/Csa1 subtype I-A
MIFIPFLDQTTNQLEAIRECATIQYRGYQSLTYPQPELIGIKLPVNLIAYNFCSNQRDVYLYAIGKKMPESFDRYRGRMIHSLYQEIWNSILKKIASTSISDLNLDKALRKNRTNILKKVRSKHKSIYRILEEGLGEENLSSLQSSLEKEMEKIYSYEIRLAAALVDFELSRALNQSVGEAFFQRIFALSINPNFHAPKLGFSSPITPDFVYKNNVVGDIKIGPWQDYYYHTITAYALAIEYHTRMPVNCGIVLHVNLDDSRHVPIHENVTFERIDDSMRKKFLMIRDQKLLIMLSKKDPGIPKDPDNCEECGYYKICWEQTQ